MKNIKGFTLAELLVVVAIIAILVAVSIPIFTSRIEASQVATCDANCRSLKSVLTTQYLSEGFLDKDLNGKINLTDEQIEEFVCPKDGKITATQNSNNSISVTCSYHDNSLGGSKLMNNIMDIMSKNTVNTTDSGACTNNKSHAYSIINALKGLGLDLSKLGAKSWLYYEKNLNDGTKKGFYWTDTDISQMKIGDDLTVMGYDYENKTYGVYSSTIGTSTYEKNEYNALRKVTPMSEDSADLSYEEAYALYLSNTKE